MKQPRNTVLTGVKALYLQGLISFNPDIYHFVFQQGSSLSYYRSKFDNMIPTTQIDEFRLLFTEQIGDYNLYTKERLLIEIDTFKIDHILKKEAIKNLFEVCDYAKVKKALRVLKKKKRFVPSNASLKFLEDQKVDFLNISVQGLNLEQYIREYILNRMYRHNINYIARGGSVIESYGNFKRGTKDNDAYLPVKKHHYLLQVLELKEDNVYFEVSDFDEKDFATIKQYKRARLILKPRSSSAKIAKAVENLRLQIDADYSLTEEELNKIKQEFNIKPRMLWKTKRKYLPLTTDMILAEKVLSVLDSQNKRAWRAKDLMDIFVISKKGYIIEKSYAWLTFKIKRSKNSFVDYQELFDLLKENFNKRLESLNDTLSTYNVKDFDHNKVLQIISNLLYFQD